MTRIRRVLACTSALAVAILFISPVAPAGAADPGVDRRQRERGRVAEDPAATRRGLRGRELRRLRDPRRGARHRRAGTDRNDLEHRRGAGRGRSPASGRIRPDAARLPGRSGRREHRPGRGGEDRRPRERAARDRPDRVRLGRPPGQDGRLHRHHVADLQRAPLPRHRAAVAVRRGARRQRHDDHETRNRRTAVGDSRETTPPPTSTTTPPRSRSKR